MRRYLLYLTVALLAFGIGSAIVFYYFYQPEKTVNDSFYQPEKTVNDSILIERDFPRFSLPLTQERKITPRRDKFLTDKEKALILFEPTINKWLDGKKIEDIIEPSSEIIQKITKEEFLYADYSELKRNAETNYKPSLIDVNGDSKNELAILSNCAEGENCQLWIFKSKEKDFEVILSSYQEVTKFSLEKAKSKDYFNIKTIEIIPDSSITSGMKNYIPTLAIKIYKFDGEQYYISGCFEYENKDGKLKLRPVHCC